MKYLICSTLFITLLSGYANADNSIYTSLKAGVSDTKLKNLSLTDDHFDATAGVRYQDVYNYENENKSAYPNISAAIGYDFSTISKFNVRTELEYTYKDKVSFNPSNDVTSYGTDKLEMDHDFRMQSLMINGYYDLKNSSKFTPYVSAGLGISRIKYNVEESLLYPQYKNSKNNFTWSAGVGVAFAVSQNVDLDLSYRYVDAGKLKLNTTDGIGNILSGKADLSSQDYTLGIRYKF